MGLDRNNLNTNAEGISGWGGGDFISVQRF